VSLPVDSPAARVATESATFVIARRMRPERERDYLAWQAEIGEQCRALGPIVSPHASGAA
jgi:antibiotic biosynthesis monooxygenase (ABM) superfamily enzyme